jgi:hypothetical protein
MNQLAIAIYTLKMTGDNSLFKLPFFDDEAFPSLVNFLNMSVDNLARLMDDLPITDWPRVQPVNPG